jgi:hypothetical protein
MRRLTLSDRNPASRVVLASEQRSVTMNSDAGGWLWLAIDVAFVALLAAALIYGITMWRNRSRSPAVEQRRDDATRRLYNTRANEE